jgi:hypothetical protein
MSPFIVTPLGVSRDTLKLIDQAFTELWQESQTETRLLGSGANKTAPPNTSPSRLLDLPAARRPLPSTCTNRSPEPAAFDYTAPAELFTTTGRVAAKRYRRFATGAEAIRYAIESLPAPLLRWSILDVGREWFDGEQIRQLYDNPAYLLSRLD